MAKLSEQQIEEIKTEYENTCNRISQRALALQYGVSYSTINRIVNPSYAAKEREANKERYKARKEIYKKNRKRSVDLTLHVVNDADIIEALAAVPNKLGYIKELIRKDLREKSKQI